MIPPKKMTEDEYRVGADEYAGLCLACGDVTCEGVEPDAEGYKFEACGERMVMGFEMALVAGHIEFAEESPA